MTKSKEKTDKKGESLKAEIKLPSGTDFSFSGKTAKVKGPKGEVTKELKVGDIIISKEGEKVVLSCDITTKKNRAQIGTLVALIKNMIYGTSNGVEYRLKVVYAHFPMNIKVQGASFVIDNFLGEKHPRTASIIPGVSVEVKGQEVKVKGIDLEKVSQTAANIEQATRIADRDLRVFQDGIYIVHKDARNF